jgi:hypothetical protein
MHHIANGFLAFTQYTPTNANNAGGTNMQIIPHHMLLEKAIESSHNAPQNIAT